MPVPADLQVFSQVPAASRLAKFSLIVEVLRRNCVGLLTFEWIEKAPHLIIPRREIGVEENSERLLRSLE